MANEVQRVMGPSTPRMSYSSPSHSLLSLSGSTTIPRKPKRKAKIALALEKYEGRKKGRVSTAVFQKKLVVFEYMGPDPPKVFTRNDKRICMRGCYRQSLLRHLRVRFAERFVMLFAPVPFLILRNAHRMISSLST